MASCDTQRIVGSIKDSLSTGDTKAKNCALKHIYTFLSSHKSDIKLLRASVSKELSKTLVFFFSTSGNIWCKCLRKCESCLWWGNYWKISSFCLSINSMISRIEGQKSNFKICILRVFILVIMPFIRNVVYSVDQFMFLVSLLFIFLKQERCKAPFHCVLTQRSLRYCSAKENNFFSQSLLPSSLQEKSFHLPNNF